MGIGGEVYDGLKSEISKSIDFAKEQIPEVIHQLLMYNLFEAVIYLIITITTITLTVYFSYHIFKKNNDEKIMDWEWYWMIFTFTHLFITLSSIIILYKNIFIILKILIAPNIYLIEYVSNLIK